MGKLRKILFNKKTIIIALVMSLTIGISTWAILGCSGNEFNSKPDINSIGQTSSTMLPLPYDGSSPADHDAKKNMYYAFTALANEKSFTTTSTGSAVTNVAFVSVSQVVKSARVINNGEIYKESLSHSTFRGVGVRIFIKNDNFVVLDADKVNSVDEVTWKTNANKVSKNSFIETYGHYSNTITAYTITDETILSAEFLGEKNGIYSYKYNLDPVKATGKISLEMRTMAGTKSLPIFERVSLTVRMDENWRVTQTVTDCVYKVDMLGGVTCTEALTENFTHYGENIPIPNGDFYRSHLDKETTEIKPETATALDYVMNGFADYITGTNPLKVSLNVDADINGTKLSVQGNAQVNIDINDLSSLSVRADIDTITAGDISLSNLFVAYQSETAYVKYGDLKACGTIDEISSIVTRILNLTGAEMHSLDGALNNFDVNSLLENAILKTEKGVAIVTLPIELGGLSLNVQLNFTDDDKIEFTGAVVALDGVDVSLAPDPNITVTELNETYHKILPLLDIIDDNNNLKLDVAIGDINAIVNFNLVDLVADIELGDITAKYIDNTIYAKYQDLKVKLAISDIEPVLNKLAPILDGKVELPDFNAIIDSIDITKLLGSAVSSISMVETENTLTISTVVESINVNIVLDITNDGYKLNNINLTIENTSVTVSPCDTVVNAIAQEDLSKYSNITSLLDIIDDNNKVSLEINLGKTEIIATIDLVELTIVASVEGAEIYVDLNTGDIYARYSGIKAKVNFNQIETIIESLKPLIDKFAGKDALGELDFGAFESIDLTNVLDSIVITENGNGVTAKLNINDIEISVNLESIDNNLTIANVALTAFGLNINAIPVQTALNVKFDLTEEYIDLKELVDTFGQPLTNVLTSDTMNVNISGALSMGNTVYNIKTANVQIDGLLGAPRANANLVLEIITTDANGNVTTTTHTIRLVYLDPSLVAEGAINVYFTYDNALDADVLEGTFTTTKANETFDILKQIYAQMPELQETLKPILVPDENGEPVLPDLNIDFTKLVNALIFNGGVLTADVNGSIFMETLPSAMQAQLSTNDGAVTLSIPSIVMDDISLNLALTLATPLDGEITDQTFAYTVSSKASDFSSINELLKSLSKTAQSRSFDINGNISMAIGTWNIAKDAIGIRAQLDVIGNKTFAVVTISREYFIGIWKDYDGTSTLYFDAENQIIYIHVKYREKILTFPGKTKNEYYKYTVEEFTADIMTPLLKMIRLSDTIEKEITKSSSSNTSSSTPTTIENTLIKYAYNNTDLFTLKLNLKQLVSELGELNAYIGHDAEMHVNSLKADLGILDMMTVSLEASLAQPYNVYQQTDVLIQQQINSGNYA